MGLYLDCDTSPALKSGYIRQRSTDGAVREAMKRISSATDGQIGIYDNGVGVGFRGYVIKYEGEVYFEPATTDDHLTRSFAEDAGAQS